MFAAYSIGVRVGLINMASGVLRLLVKDFSRTEEGAARLQKRVGLLQRDLFKAGAYMAVGVGGLMLFKKPIEEAARFQITLARLQALGLGAKVNADALQFARGMDIYGASMIDKLGIMRDTLSVFNDLDKARIAAPMIAKMSVANRVLYGKDRGDEITQGTIPLLKVAELRGGINDPARLKAQIDWAEKSFIASGGMVKPQDYLNAMRVGGIPLKMMSDMAFFVKSEPLMQELGGFRFGTGINAIYSNLVQGREPVRGVKELLRLKLIDPKMVEYTSIGTVKRMKPGALIGQDLLIRDPYSWIHDVLLPHLKAAGIDPNDKMKVSNEIGAIAPNSRAANLMSTAYLQQVAIARAEQRVPHAANIQRVYASAQSTLTGAELNLTAKWRDLMIDIGKNLLPAVVPGMNALAGAIKSLDAAVNAHPTQTRWALTAASGLFLALAGKGVVTGAAALLRFIGVLSTTSIGGAAASAGAGAGGLAARTGVSFGWYGLAVAAAIETGRRTYEQFRAPSWANAWSLGQLNPLVGYGLGAPAGVAGYLWKNGASPFVPGSRSSNNGQPIILNMDGRRVCSGILPHINRALGAPHGGSTNFDPSMSFTPPAYPGGF